MFSSGWESELKEKNFSGQASVTTQEATSMEQDAVYFPGRNSIAPSMKTLQDEAKGGCFDENQSCETRVQAVLPLA